MIDMDEEARNIAVLVLFIFGAAVGFYAAQLIF